MTRRLLLLAALVSLLAAPAHAKRRATNAPGGPLWATFPLQSIERIDDTRDLAPLRAVVGNASMVGLGDATHGTHEFYALRLRMLDSFVRELGFDVVSLEAPYAITERLNIYVQGGPGNPRAILGELDARLLYFFWNVQELLDVIEWMRTYNAHRGDAPPIELAGADIYDESGAATMVIDYLQRVDPFAAAIARDAYTCVYEGRNDGGCEQSARQVRDALALRNDHSRPSEDALHAADVVLQFFHLQFGEPREFSMSQNLLWIREHRGRSRKVVHWGHQEHVGKLPSPLANGKTMGTFLHEQLGRDYVAIGTLTGSGTFLQWERSSSGTYWFESPKTFPSPTPGSYEATFRTLGASPLLILLRGRSEEASFRTAGTTTGFATFTQALGRKLDALIYIDVTTPTRSLR